MFRVLVVDDDKNTRFFIKEALELEGYEVFTAGNGEEALEVYDKEYIDLVIVDIMMPKVDGLKVLKVIRQLERQKNVADEDHLKIIMMTALADVGYVDEAFRQGCDAYASKPVDTDKVENVMRNLGLIE